MQFVILALIVSSLVSFFFGGWQPVEATVDASTEALTMLPFWAVFVSDMLAGIVGLVVFRRGSWKGRVI